MSLAALLVGKKAPILEELEVVGSGASASSVVKAVVRDPGGFSKISKDQIIAVKKVYVPRYSVIQQERKRRLEIKATTSATDSQLVVVDDELDDDSMFDPDEGGSCDSQDERRCEALEREVSLLKSLQHPNIVSCYGVTHLADQNMLGILMEYCPGNSLRHYYRKQQHLVQEGLLDKSALVNMSGLPEETVRRFASQMLSGLVYLHDKGVVHRDLKGLNVLLSDDVQTCKLADFGSATRIALSGSDARFHSMQGTVWWMAPEQFLLGKSGSGKEHCVDGSGGTFVADIWSLGCTILELALGAIPFTHVSGGQFGLMVLLSRPSCDMDELFPEAVVNAVPPKVMAFVRRCLVRDPAKRPSALELMQDPWMQGVSSSPRASRVASTMPSRQCSATADSFSSPSDSQATNVSVITNNNITTIPESIPEKLHPAAVFWLESIKSFESTTSVGELCRHMRVPSMAEIVAPFFSFPRGSGLPNVPTLTAQSQIDFQTFLMFVSFFGPFDTLMSDMWSLEVERYACIGYSTYGAYAEYETTDSSHLLLSCLSKPYVKVLASQTVVEEELRTAAPGTFTIRYSSKCVESPGSLTLSVKGEHGVLHHRILRPQDGWAFLIVTPTPQSSRTSQRRKDVACLTGAAGAPSTTREQHEKHLCFDTIEDLVKYFCMHGIPSQRSDRRYRLIV